MTDLAQLGQPADDIDRPAPDDLHLWSVTALLNVLHKEGLVFWSAEEASNAAIDSQATWKGMLQDRGRAEAVKWLRDARFRPRRDLLSAAGMGQVVHDACEQYALSGVKPDLAWLEQTVRKEDGKNNLTVDAVRKEAESAAVFVDQFDGWLAIYQPSYQAAEVTVYSPKYGYAGTLDALMTVGGTRVVADYKTSRKSFDTKGNPTGPYPEVSLQLAAYRWAEAAAVWRPRRFEKSRRRYYALSPAEIEAAVPVPEVDGGLVIHISPLHCTAYPVKCDEQVHRSFLYVLEAARWQFELSKTAIGQPLERD